jgi:protein-L-isoaspartate(D-aspartate) O-methyltransferase
LTKVFPAQDEKNAPPVFAALRNCGRGISNGNSRMANIDQDRLPAIRTAYAREICAAARLAPDSEIERAFAATPREKFVGPPLWRILSSRGQTRTTSGNPALLYQDALVSLGGEPGLNNGQPSLHAMCLAALSLKRGERVIHVGAGTGYYTSVMALLVGESGLIDAYEIEPDLAARANTNVSEFLRVRVHGRSGAVAPLPECDAIYANAAAAEPLAVWLDALRPGGRLLFPLAARDGAGQMLLLTRTSEREFDARFLCQVQFVPCIGAQDEQAGRALQAAFKRSHPGHIRRLVRNNAPGQHCWLAGNGWWME